MKICVINNLYKPYARGGAERVAENIVNELLKKGHDVKIITTRPFFSSPPIFKDKTNIYYLPSLYYNLNKIPKIFRFFWHIVDVFCIKNYWRVKKILKKEKPDIVMTHNLKGIGFLTAMAIRSLGIKHIHTLHDIQLLHPSGLMIYGEEKITESIFSKVYTWICKKLFASPSVVVSPSKWLLDMHISRGFFLESKKIVMPNPAVAIEKNNLEEKNNKIFKFLYVGQIENHKGVSFLVKVFNKIKEDKIELEIVGPGLILEKIKKEAKDNIKVLGGKNKKEVADLMKDADCLIVPSLCYENSPTVIYEAFAIGLPVIASRIGGIGELLPDNNLFEPGNEEDLKKKIDWVLENSDKVKDIGKKGMARIDELSAHNYVEKLLNLF